MCCLLKEELATVLYNKVFAGDGTCILLTTNRLKVLASISISGFPTTYLEGYSLLGRASSPSSACTASLSKGVPQGSILGPL